MVFTALCNFVRSRGPDEIWRKRKIFKLSAHYVGRRRNCYSIAIRSVHRALAYATSGRKLKKEEMKNLWQTRLEGSCEQFGISAECFQEGLARTDILLNRKMLADLAIWEPKSFESLVTLCRERAASEGYSGIKGSTSNNVCGLNKVLDA